MQYIYFNYLLLDSKFWLTIAESVGAIIFIVSAVAEILKTKNFTKSEMSNYTRTWRFKVFLVIKIACLCLNLLFGVLIICL
jgi:hypothetical protein